MLSSWSSQLVFNFHFQGGRLESGFTGLDGPVTPRFRLEQVGVEARGQNHRCASIFLLIERVLGDLYAKGPIETYPGVAIEPVTDSSRYFVIRLQNDNGQTAFVGMGFADRGDSFDLNVALQVRCLFCTKLLFLGSLQVSQQISRIGKGTSSAEARSRIQGRTDNHDFTRGSFSELGRN